MHNECMGVVHMRKVTDLFTVFSTFLWTSSENLSTPLKRGP